MRCAPIRESAPSSVPSDRGCHRWRHGRGLPRHTLGSRSRVALKLLTPEYADDEGFRARFLRRSKLAAAIDHPNIIPIYEAGQIDGTFFLAMRYVEGIDLQRRLVSGPLDPRTPRRSWRKWPPR
jgi:serine/threonine protein kinase